MRKLLTMVLILVVSCLAEGPMADGLDVSTGSDALASPPDAGTEDEPEDQGPPYDSSPDTFPLDEWQAKCERPGDPRDWLHAWGIPYNHPGCDERCKKLRRWKLRQNKETDALVRFLVKRSNANIGVYKLLRVVYRRESFGGVPGLAHRLNRDIEANTVSLRKRQDKYLEKGNEHANEPRRWRGLGLYGMNSAIFVPAWSWTAPPEVLCDSVVSTLVYMRKLRRTRRKFVSGAITCVRKVNGVKERYRVERKPTWENLHRAVSGGQLCPPTTPDGAYYANAFRKRAKWQHLDPDQIVTARMLGEEPEPPEGGDKYDLVDELWVEHQTQQSN